MKLPEKIYVALRYTTDLIRGYLVIADKEETKYCQKNKDKADICAGRSGKSMYITNEAREGFRVIDYTSDGMLIEHPEGFSFYISPRNMYDLIRTCTIVNGDINNKLYFSDTLTLISEVSEILSETLQREENLAKRKELLKSLKFNDHFKYDKNECVMIGRYHVLSLNQYGYELNSKSKLMYIFKNLGTGKYMVEPEPLPNLKFGSKAGTFFDNQDYALQLAKNQFDSVDQYGRRNYQYVGISTKPIKAEQIKSKFIECELSELEVTSAYPRISVIALDDGTYKYFAGFQYYKNNQYSSWGSNYSSCSYSDVDSHERKYYMTKFLRKEGELYYVQDRYNSYNDDDRNQFRCEVSKLNIKVGYLEFYL